jgi:hypothetical protein
MTTGLVSDFSGGSADPVLTTFQDGQHASHDAGPMVFWTLVLVVWALFEGVPKMLDYGARSILLLLQWDGLSWRRYFLPGMSVPAIGSTIGTRLPVETSSSMIPSLSAV